MSETPRTDEVVGSGGFIEPNYVIQLCREIERELAWQVEEDTELLKAKERLNWMRNQIDVHKNNVSLEWNQEKRRYVVRFGYKTVLGKTISQAIDAAMESEAER